MPVSKGFGSYKNDGQRNERVMMKSTPHEDDGTQYRAGRAPQKLCSILFAPHLTYWN